MDTHLTSHVRALYETFRENYFDSVRKYFCSKLDQIDYFESLETAERFSRENFEVDQSDSLRLSHDLLTLHNKVDQNASSAFPLSSKI